MSGLAIEFKMTPRDFGDRGAAFSENLLRGAVDVHDMWVMRVSEYMTKFSRVDTGRSRAGWFSFMDSKGYNYQRSLPPTRDMKDESSEGRAEGMFVSQPFNTTLINNVKYVDPMNKRFGLFGFANMTSGKMYLGSEGIHFEEKIPLFEAYGEENYQRYIDNCVKAFDAGGKVFQPSEIAPVVNDPPMTE